MAGVGYLLPLQRVTSPWWMDLEAMERAEKLIAQALLIAPLLEDALRSQMYLLLKQDRWKDAMAAADRFIEMFPNSPSGYFVLATCKTYTGNAEEEIPLLETAIRHNLRTPALYVIFFRMGFASLMAGRDADAIAFDERSLGLIPTANVMFRQNTMRQMASAYARMGKSTNRMKRWPRRTAAGRSTRFAATGRRIRPVSSMRVRSGPIRRDCGERACATMRMRTRISASHRMGSCITNISG